MLYLDLFCASVSKMFLKVSGETKRASEGVTLSMKLDVIKCFDCGERDKDINEW